jgi:DNA topoisomerase IB
MVNRYLKSISDEDFTAKDFRIWAGSVHALPASRELGSFDTATDTKKYCSRVGFGSYSFRKYPDSLT